MMTDRSKLHSILEFLKGRVECADGEIWIPAIWNTFGCEAIQEDAATGEIQVNAYRFMAQTIESIFQLSEAQGTSDEREPQEAVIYTALARYTTAWDYDRDGNIESGTFLRLMALLPMMKRLGVSILYLLPVTQYSSIKKKGDIGSPYAVKNYFELDPDLHDPLLDQMDGLVLHDELAALVEACHILGIKVVHDLIPRTAARDCAFIEEHPDWVYWVTTDDIESFRPPQIPGFDVFEECTPDKIDAVYQCDAVKKHLRRFSPSPKDLDAEKWEALKLEARTTGKNLLLLVEQEMGITTAPAHSDWLNDKQPVWTDITFLRLYQDPSPTVRKYLNKDQAPYVLFDTIKCNLYPGERPNIELWNLIEEAARFGMEKYGFDGYRIDIGHALPVVLMGKLFKTIRGINPEAIIISEDLFNRNHKKAREAGYDMMLGSGWDIMSEISKDRLLNYLKELPNLGIPVFACAETPDTPRITSRHGGEKLARTTGVFNCFLPNGIQFITTGYEVHESEPLNCGLADNTGGADIPRAFFNRSKIQWTNENHMVDLLADLSSCRKQYRDVIKRQNFFVAETDNDVIIYGYRNANDLVLGCFNIDMENAADVYLSSLLPACESLAVVIDTEKTAQGGQLTEQDFILGPGQSIVVARHAA